MNLSEKMFWVRDYDLDKLKMNILDKNGETDEDNVILVKDVKEFIKFEKARRENQLRIHWNWLKDKPYTEIVKFLNAITNKKAGDELI